MTLKEKIIIEKLVKLASKQQQILAKLAQDIQNVSEDIEANKEYIGRAWMTAGLNTGMQVSQPELIEYTPSSPTDKTNVVMGGTYTVTGVVPVAQREKFNDTFNRQLSLQRPDLSVGVIFRD